MTLERPGVTLSYAQTLDGRLATRSGSSQWIGGPESLVLAHALRAQHDAIMVGVGTVLADNPRLTVRHVAGADPLRVVVDSTLRTPPSAAVLSGGAAANTLLATTDRAAPDAVAALRGLGATVLRLPGPDGRVDLRALLQALHARGVGSIMVEGGAALITALLAQRLADRIAVTIAPKILGRGVEAVGDLGIDALSAALQLDGMTVERYGVDLVVRGELRYPAEPLHG